MDRLHFPSLASLREYAVNAPLRCQGNGNTRARMWEQASYKPTWYGFGARVTDVPAAVERDYRAGYPTAAALVQRLAEHFTPPRVATARRRRVRGDMGDEYDRDAARSGQLDRAWTAARRLTARAPGIVHIVVDRAANSGVDPMALVWRGAAALALVQEYVKAGHHTRVTVARYLIPSYRRSPQMLMTLTAKLPQQRVAPSVLALALAHPGIQRLWMHHAQVVHAEQELGEGIASSVPVTRELLPTNKGETLVLVPSSVDNESTAKAFLKEVHHG